MLILCFSLILVLLLWNSNSAVGGLALAGGQWRHPLKREWKPEIFRNKGGGPPPLEDEPTLPPPPPPVPKLKIKKPVIPPPPTETSGDIQQAETDQAIQEKKRRGISSTLLAGETGGYSAGKTLLG